MIGVAKQVQVGGHFGFGKQSQRLRGGGDRIDRAVQQHQGARTHLVHHIFGPKVKHALRRLGGELLNGARYQLALQARWQRHDLHARHHEGRASFFAVGAPLGQHLGEVGPGLWCGVLAAKLVLAMAPASGGNHTSYALVDSAGETAGETVVVAWIDRGPQQPGELWAIAAKGAKRLLPGAERTAVTVYGVLPGTQGGR